MAVTHPVPETTEGGANPETFLHVVARDFQWVLRGLCVLLLFTTVVVMVTFNFWAIVPAVMLLMCYAVLVIADGIEHVTDTRPPPVHSEAVVHEIPVNDDALEPEVRRQRETDRAVEQRLTRIALEVLFGAVALGGTLGVILFGWELLPVAIMVLAGYALLVSTPFWLAWMEKDMQEEVARRTPD